VSGVRGGASASPAGREFEIAYVDAEYGERRLALIHAWSVRFEECMPVRGVPYYKGQSLLGLRDGIEPNWWITSEDGQTLLPDNPKHVFYADCPPDVAERVPDAVGFRVDVDLFADRSHRNAYLGMRDANRRAQVEAWS